MSASNLLMIASNFHVLAKPIGPICNLDCKYCFYLEKESLYPRVEKWGSSSGVAALRNFLGDFPLH
jgi:uncharacterized protein